ncbi:AMP-binding protein [Sphingomonas immobilis]|uniref:AMP-binding protein n=1 Tax=Sphingomonas immobilis TaxID=3063997 RepID=A0ABT9A2A7_9SPHN|nr:AMP-binding protein [Sphingomonas sp. CA1-15]MDO7843126.1 AMP-binding protein [Sphingomonas sp. CA1-15]
MADPRMLTADESVLRNVLERHAAERPDQVFAIFDGGDRWTYAALASRVRRAASALYDLGVRQDDCVAVWLPNGPDILVAWFAINYLGAVYVPINVAYRGALLKHAIDLSSAEIAIMHGGLIERLADIDCATLRRVIALGDEAVAPPGLELLPATLLDEGADALVPLTRPVEPWDVQSIIFTSGTTGPSKGVLSTYMHLATTGLSHPRVNDQDRQLVTLPMFHAGGTGAVYRMLLAGGSIVMVASFRTQDFWPVVVGHGVTAVVLLGVMSAFLVNEPLGDMPAHRLRHVLVLPLDKTAIEFGKRFGCDVRTVFNMTETSMPIISDINPTALGSCGRPRPGIEARIVDEFDCEVANGDLGELLLRSDAPWVLAQGYYRNPEATAAAWRNGWFHTGDRFRKDAEGNYYFVDRAKDAIRRRGENISSFEVEAELGAHPAVREAAVVAVQSDVSEDEVMAVVALSDGATLDPIEMIEFLRPRMAHFMIPRYLRIVAELPKTPTMKVQKHVLRADGITPDTWDRVAAKIEIRRERL